MNVMPRLKRTVGLCCVALAFTVGVAHAQSDSVLLVTKSGRQLLRVNSDGNVGIATPSPTSRLQVDSGMVTFNGIDGFVAKGVIGIGALPASGDGVRMMWYPRKAAFRVGRVTSSQWDNINIGEYSFAAGYNATASRADAFAFGNYATATGVASFAMGYAVVASATHSFALGYGANANHTGSFVYADSYGTLNSTQDNQFMVRASGGTVFYTNLAASLGVELFPNGGAWSNISDRNRKENFVSLEGEDVLARLSGVPVTSWNYKTQDRLIRHIGPMAQDLHAAFGMGESERHINTIDIDGINMAAVQAVALRTDALRADNEKQAARITVLESENASLQERLDRIEAAIAASNRDEPGN